jgi:sarcosine oxidase gamma subunit
MRNLAILAGVSALSVAIATTALSQGRGGQPGGGALPGQAGRGGPQQAAPAQPPGAVTGQVVSATTGEPLRKVTLSLRPQGRGGAATTTTSDNAGNFRFAAVEPGTYTLTGERTGFVRGAYGEDRPGGQPRPIEVTSNNTTGGIQLKLTPHSVITGRVYDLDGDPVQNAQVQVLRYSYPQGQRQLTPVAQATTNDLGEFRVANLAPGRYYVSATDTGALANLRGAIQDLARGGRAIDLAQLAGRGGRGGILDALFGRGGGDPDPEAYVTTYYPRAIDPSGATPLDLVPGSEMRGIDIGLLKGRKYTISGIVENLPALPAPGAPALAQGKQAKGKQFGGPGGGGAIVNLVPRTSAAQPLNAAAILTGAGGIAQVNADGAFEIRNVQPGSYYLMAQGGDPQLQQRLAARVPVEVTSGDVRNVRIRLEPPLAVIGRITPEKPDTALNLQNVRINFNSATPQGLGGRGGGRGAAGGRIEIAADGRFQTQLDADTYAVEVQGVPQGYYLKAVKVAGREVPDNILDLTYGGAQLELVLANDSGAISGRVERSNNQAVANARVTVVPASNSPRRDLYKSATTGADGSFIISGLPPGNYKVYAWEEVEQNAWMDPDFRRPFESLAASATIRDASGPNLTLRLIGREQMSIVQ